jgi:hypothetical protein
MVDLGIAAAVVGLLAIVILWALVREAASEIARLRHIIRKMLKSENNNKFPSEYLTDKERSALDRALGMI